MYHGGKWRSEDNMGELVFSPSNVWVPGTEFRPLVLDTKPLHQCRVLIFKTKSYVAWAGLRVTVWPWITLNDSSSHLCRLNSGITGVDHLSQQTRTMS